MPVYLSPGVYVEEIRGTPPIAPVGTSTAGFVGVTMNDVDMPFKPGSTTDHFLVAAAGEPQLITNWEQFKNKFGDFQAKKAAWSEADYNAYRRFQHAIFGFFNNGGSRCWVIRLAAETDLTDLADDLKKFEPIDEIAIVAVPGATTKAQQDAIIDHCKGMLDRFAILDGTQNPAAFTVNDIKGGDPANPTKDSDFAALYFPWIKILDPIAGTDMSQPLSGHLAGVYARVDAERGVHRAPANEIIRGAVNLDYRLSKADQDGLNPLGINVIRAFNGNFTIWGARTLGGNNNGEFKYINVRRLFNFLRESIEEGTQFVVFEPNAPPLWQKIRRTVTAFLTNVWRDGALFGDTPERAFFVKCDETTNPPEVRDLGQVVTEICVAVVKPAEFVIFRISQFTGGGAA